MMTSRRSSSARASCRRISSEIGPATFRGAGLLSDRTGRSASGRTTGLRQRSFRSRDGGWIYHVRALTPAGRSRASPRRFSARYSCDARLGLVITAFPRRLSVTEGSERSRRDARSFCCRSFVWPDGSSRRRSSRSFFLCRCWPWHSCMDRTTELHYLISGNNQFGRVNLSRATAAAAVKKARELVQEGYFDVRISTPRGRVLLSDEFDQLEG